MTFGRASALMLAIVAFSAADAGAQTLPWPTDAPAAPAPMATGPAAPASIGAPPQAAAPRGNMPPCFAEFTARRQEVEKRALAAKAAGEKRVSREEMCKLVQSFAAAEAKWIKFAEENMASCGIPKQAIEQIKGGHAGTLAARKKLCSVGPAQAGPPPAPSLSDALGTARLPAPETAKPSRGTFDTLTGNALAR